MGQKKIDTKYAIIDIETTGGMFKRDKITEIAIVVHDGKKIVDQFDTLINPERSIPFEITRITGITDEMVENAPKFYEIAKQVVEITEGCIFVAHNVRFDYGFICEEFNRLGYTYTRKQLCTVRLSRKAFPGLKSYSLGNLIRHFNISVNARHRALDDTLATVEVFEKILALEKNTSDVHTSIKRKIREQKLPESLTPEMIDALPDQPGVYYFHNSQGRVIYVGKSISIRTRVKQHFSKITSKSEAFVRSVTHITFDLTGSELLALLHESEEIKSLRPSINKAQRNSTYPYALYYYQDEQGFINFEIALSNKKQPPKNEILSYFKSLASAKSRLGWMRSEFSLCEIKFVIKGKPVGRCVYYAMGECYGACQGIEDSEVYNERASLAKDTIQRVFDKDFIILVEGRSENELGAVLVENGIYRGFGYIEKRDAALGVEEILESIELKRATIECNQIISNYLEKHEDFEIINF